jgi:hypothetical protein
MRQGVPSGLFISGFPTRQSIIEVNYYCYILACIFLNFNLDRIESKFLVFKSRNNDYFSMLTNYKAHVY